MASLKWITSFPGNPAQGLPTVTGIVILSDATTAEPLMLLDARSVTALRTGAVAAVAARALAQDGARERRDRRLRACTAPGPRAASRPRATARGSLPTPTGGGRRRSPPSWAGGRRRSPTRCASDVVCCVTPGAEPVVEAGDLHPGLHLNMLGADGPGKAEATIGAVATLRACSATSGRRPPTAAS